MHENYSDGQSRKSAKEKESTCIENAIPKILLASQCFLRIYHTQNPLAGTPAISSDKVNSNAVIHNHARKKYITCQNFPEHVRM